MGALTFFAVDPNLRSTYLYQFNFGIQRRLGEEFSIEVDYQGSEGHKLAVVNDPNQPAVIVRDPAQRGPVAPNEQVFLYNHFGGVYQFKSVGNSSYHGMVVTGKYQGRGGVFFQGSYTVGKSIDDHSSFFNAGLGESPTTADNNSRRL